MRDVRIEPKDEGKGRTFRATLLASVEADSMWEGGLTGTDDARPVWAMFAASDAELRPFQANLATGRKIIVGKEGSHYRRRSDKIELLKTAGYQYTWQREAEGSILTACMMDLFRRDPGMVDPTGACFVVMPTEAWLASPKVDKVDEIVAHARHGFIQSREVRAGSRVPCHRRVAPRARSPGVPLLCVPGPAHPCAARLGWTLLPPVVVGVPEREARVVAVRP